MTGCTLFTKADAGELKARELNAWDSHSLHIIKECNRLEITVTLYEHERDNTRVRPETWPPVVRDRIEKEAGAWAQEHKERVVRAVTFGVSLFDSIPNACVMIVHHEAKS